MKQKKFSAIIVLACLSCQLAVAQEQKSAPQILTRIEVPNIDPDHKIVEGKITEKINTPSGEISVRWHKGLNAIYFKNKILLENDFTIFLGAYATHAEENPSLFMVESNCLGNACAGPDTYLIDIANEPPYISPALSIAQRKIPISVSRIDNDTYIISENIYTRNEKSSPVTYIYHRKTRQIAKQE